MDLNDPRRRLQVATQSNPSLRVSVSPQKPLAVTTVQNSPKLFVGSTQINAAPNAVVEKDQRGTNVGGYADSSIIARIPRATAGTAVNIGGGLLGVAKGTAELPSVAANLPNFGRLVTAKVTGNEEAEAGAGKAIQGNRVANWLSNKLSPITGRLERAELKTDEISGRLIPTQTSFSKNLAKVASNLLPVDALVAAGSKASGISKATKPITSKSINTIIAETDPSNIQQALKVNNDIAEFLAQEKSPDAIRAVLEQVKVDPSLSLSPDDLQRFQDAGITDVRQDPNDPYGASYKDNQVTFSDQSKVTPDNVYHELGHHIYRNKLTPQERELFAGINGKARQQAAGRAGYTTDDMISEDFSDFLRMAIQGKISEVPASVRGVVAKYAKVAEKELGTATDDLRMTPAVANARETVKDPRFATSLAKTASPDSVDPLTNMVKVIADTNKGKDISYALFGGKGLLKGLNVDKKTQQAIVKELGEETDPAVVSRKISQLVSQANADSLTKVADDVTPTPAPVANNVDEVSEAVSTTQTGTSAPAAATPEVAPVAQADNVGEIVNKNADEATAPQSQPTDDAVLTYTNENGKTRSSLYGDLKKEVEDLQAIPRDELSAAKTKRLDMLEKRLNVMEFDAKRAFPDATPEEHTAIQEVMDGLNGALKGYDSNKPVRAKEKAQRFARGSSNFDASAGGEAGMNAKLSAMRGSYSKSSWEAITASPEARDSIINTIESVGRGNKMREGQILNTQIAMQKVWGTVDSKPTPSDIRNIRNFFGDQMADLVDQVVKMNPKTWREQLAAVPGFFKSIASTGDLSGGFRQAGVLGSGHPVLWAKAQAKALRYAVDSDYMAKEMKKIEDDPLYEMSQEHGLDLPAVLGGTEEEFMSSDLLTGSAAKKIGVGHIVAGSQRAYDGILTELRFSVYKQSMKNLGGEEVLTKKDLVDLAEVINTASGRGGKKGGLVDKHAATLSTTLFSPRLWASRLNQLNPQYYARLSPVARKEAARNMVAFSSVAATTLLAFKQAGFEVETDSRSSDFLKIKKGNTRYDVLGGFQQNIVWAMRMQSGESKSSTSGDVTALSGEDKPFGGDNRLTATLKFGANKLNPLFGTGSRLIAGEDRGGNALNPFTEIGKLFAPLGLQGLYSAADDQGNLLKGAAINTPSVFGVGVQTYGNTKSSEKGQTVSGKPTFKGEVKDNYVLDNDGKPMMDDKGKVIKAKFDDDATAGEKQAALKTKQKEAYTAQAKASLSADDRTIYKLGKADQDSLSDEQLKKFQEVNKYVEDYGKKIDVPREVKSDAGRAFYQKYNSMTKDDQKAWLSEKPDANAKTIAETINKTRTKGLPEFTPSNKLSKAYAEFEKNMASHPEYTDIDKRHETKEFQKFALKLNYADDAQDLYQNASKSEDELRYVIGQGKITKEALAKAIELDNTLFSTGLNGSVTFSKKFRTEYGFGMPTGPGGIAGGGSGSDSGGSGSKRTGINSLVPSFKSGNGGDKPTVSARPRNISFKSGVKAPQKSTRKININL